MKTIPLIVLTLVTLASADPLPSSTSPQLDSKISTDLVLDAFETFRRLIQVNSGDKDSQPGVSLYSPLQSLDPLVLSKPIVHECRDASSPDLGKIVLTLDSVQFSGLSQFKVEQVSSAGPCLNFQHLIPQLDTCANYTVDYYLFDAIPLRISEGQLKATLPKAKIVGRFFSFPSVIGDWSRMSQFNLTTTVDEDMALMVSPKYTISDRFVLKKNMNRFDAAIRSSLPEVSEILKGAYSRVIEMKLGD